MLSQIARGLVDENDPNRAATLRQFNEAMTGAIMAALEATDVVTDVAAPAPVLDVDEDEDYGYPYDLFDYD